MTGSHASGSETTESDLAYFCGLSSWLDIWLRSSIWPDSMLPIREGVANSDRNLKRISEAEGASCPFGQLGEYGPQFCKRFWRFEKQLAAMNTGKTVFSIAVIGEEKHYASAHEAAYDLVDRIGQMLFQSEWHEAVVTGRPVGKSIFEIERTHSAHATVVGLVCDFPWNSDRAQFLASRLVQERSSLELMQAKPPVDDVRTGEKSDKSTTPKAKSQKKTQRKSKNANLVKFAVGRIKKGEKYPSIAAAWNSLHEGDSKSPEAVRKAVEYADRSEKSGQQS
jgi:hypothetical protein